MVKRLGPSRCGARDTTLPGATPDRRGPGRATERTHHVTAPRRVRVVARLCPRRRRDGRGAVRAGSDRVQGHVDSELVARGVHRRRPGDPRRGRARVDPHVVLPVGPDRDAGVERHHRPVRPQRHGDQRSVERRHPGRRQHLVRLPGHLHGLQHRARRVRPQRRRLQRHGTVHHGARHALRPGSDRLADDAAAHADRHAHSRPPRPPRPRRPPSRPTPTAARRSSATASSPRPGRRPAARGP